jgi:hypothetical protein
MGDETVRLTYSELAHARGITLAAARRMTLRHKWPKQVGNDGLSRVSVPVSALARPDDAGTGDMRHAGTANGTGTAAGNGKDDTPGDGTDDITAAVRSLGDAVTSLTAQLIREQERADRAEGRAQDAESRTVEAERRVQELAEKLEAEMIEHRQVVTLLTQQLAARRSWWPWRRQS